MWSIRDCGSISAVEVEEQLLGLEAVAEAV
jgi:hypothetical protein